tara:strand:- start:983 stop:1252 length:270 start_codon:yes stop_codon:yes gene_type:complete
MAKRRRKLSPELEKNISLAKKQIELITAIIHDIDEEDIQEEYKKAFLPVMSSYMSLDQMYNEFGFNEDTNKQYQLYITNLDRFKNEYEL